LKAALEKPVRPAKPKAKGKGKKKNA
jgi:hypothetical protein